MNDLTGRVAIVTGASKGIGAAIAKAMGAAGAAVIVNYATSREGAERVVAEVIGAGGRALAVQGDVASAADAGRIVAEAVAAFGRLDILVNNAAYFTFGPLETITEAEFHRHFDTNVLGAILMTRAALEHLRPGASVINLGSAGTRNPPPNTTLYLATKAALDTITQVLAQELGDRQIRVNSIAPGTTETEGNPIGSMNEATQRLIVGKTALRRVGTPPDIAPAAVFLASDDAAWVTGETLRVSGGFA